MTRAKKTWAELPSRIRDMIESALSARADTWSWEGEREFAEGAVAAIAALKRASRRTRKKVRR